MLYLAGNNTHDNTIRVNGVAQKTWSAVAGSEEMAYDRGLSISVSAGDSVSFYGLPSGSDTLRFYSGALGIETTGQVYTIWGLAGSQSFVSTSNPTFYLPANGPITSSSTST